MVADPYLDRAIDDALGVSESATELAIAAGYRRDAEVLRLEAIRLRSEGDTDNAWGLDQARMLLIGKAAEIERHVRLM